MLAKQKELLKTFQESTFKNGAEGNDKAGKEQVDQALKSIHEVIASRLALFQLQRTPIIDQKEIEAILDGASAYDKFNKEQEVAVRLAAFMKANKGLSMADYSTAEDAIRKQIDLQDELAAAQKIASNNRVAAIDREIAALEKLRGVAVSQGKSTTAIDAQLHQDQLQREQDIAAQLIATGKLGNLFKGTIMQMITEGKQWQQGVGNAFKQGVAGMNNNLTQLATTGKADFRGLAQSMTTDILQVALKYAESQLFMLASQNEFIASALAAMGIHTAAQVTANATEAQSSAATAGANTLADVPFPENIPAAATVTGIGEAFAADALASRGALLPNREMNVRTHPEEMILPKNISNFIVKSMGNQTGGDQPPSYTYAPQINAGAATAKELSQFMAKEQEKQQRKQMRKHGIRSR